MSGAQVTMSMDEFDALRKQASAALEEAGRLRAQLREAKLEDPLLRVLPLLSAFNHAMVIVRFAVANLDPATVRGWPHVDLFKLGQSLPKLPDADQNTEELALELLSFAREAEDMEKFRAERAAGSVSKRRSKK